MSKIFKNSKQFIKLEQLKWCHSWTWVMSITHTSYSISIGGKDWRYLISTWLPQSLVWAILMTNMGLYSLWREHDSDCGRNKNFFQLLLKINFYVSEQWCGRGENHIFLSEYVKWVQATVYMKYFFSLIKCTQTHLSSS